MIDKIDKKILNIVQNDADISLEKLSELIGLSKTPCWRRLNKLQDRGIIGNKVCIINRKVLGYTTQIIARIKIILLSDDSFVEMIQDVPEITLAHGIAGEYDYSLHILCTDMDHYQKVKNNICKNACVIVFDDYIVTKEAKNNQVVNFKVEDL